MTMQCFSGLNEAELMREIGPAPKLSAVAKFLGESAPTTCRRLKNGQLAPVGGSGVIRISLKSLVRMLNGTEEDYTPTHANRGRKAKAAK
jgi:hypothetical protein